VRACWRHAAHLAATVHPRVRAEAGELVQRQQFGISDWTVLDEWVGRASAMPDIAKVIVLR